MPEEPPLSVATPEETSSPSADQPVTPPQFTPPPTPPAMLSSLPTYFRRVICKECLRESHDISYYHCLNCHQYGNNWYKEDYTVVS
jgi:hypothetical protein